MTEKEPKTSRSLLQSLEDLLRRRLPIERLAEIATNTSWEFEDGDFNNLISGNEFGYYEWGGDRYKRRRHTGINLDQEELSKIRRAIIEKFESLKGDPKAGETRQRLLMRVLSNGQVEGFDIPENYLLDAVAGGYVGAEVLTFKYGPASLLKLSPSVITANLARRDVAHDDEGLEVYDTPLNQAVYSLKMDLLKAVGIFKTDGKDAPMVVDEAVVPMLPNIIDAIERLSFRVGSDVMRQHASRIKDYFASFNSGSAFETLVAAVDSKVLIRNKSEKKLIRSKPVVSDIRGSRSVGQEYADGWHMAQDYEEYCFDRVENTYEYFEYPEDNPIARGAVESLARIAGNNPSLTPKYERALKRVRKKYEHSPRRKTTTIREETNIRPIPGIKTSYRYLDF